MIFIIDTNVLLSALIKDSATRKILIETDWDFLYPQIAIKEIHKHKDFIIQKAGITEQNYNLLLFLMMKKVKTIPENLISERLDEAMKIMQHVDSDDVVFIAASLAMNSAPIWTDDKDFLRQNKIEIWNSQQIYKLYKSAYNSAYDPQHTNI